MISILVRSDALGCRERCGCISRQMIYLCVVMRSGAATCKMAKITFRVRCIQPGSATSPAPVIREYRIGRTQSTCGARPVALVCRILLLEMPPGHTKILLAPRPVTKSLHAEQKRFTPDRCARRLLIVTAAVACGLNCLLTIPSALQYRRALHQTVFLGR